MALDHAKSGEVVNVRAHGSPVPGAKSSALVKRDRFEAVRLIVQGGTTIPPHKVPGFLTLYCLDGHVILETDHEIDLREGDWIYLERGVTHAVRGIDDSTLLLTIMFD